MPKARAPKAPWVEVWLSPQTMVGAGQGEALLRADDVHDALPLVVETEVADAEAARVVGQRLHLQPRARGR